VKGIGYHFVGDRLRDGRVVPPDGEWLVHEGEIKMCERGLHLSCTPFQALRYAPGPILCRVQFGGRVIEDEDEDKIVCTRRMIERRFDATELLRSFARAEALRVIHLWDAPDVVVQYLKTGDESLRSAARDTAGAAAGAAAWDAARAAAWDTAWDAARAAARDAAWAAAQDAAGGAAGAAAGDAAWDAAGERFNALVYDHFQQEDKL